MKISNSELIKIDRALAAHSLVDFVQMAWPVLEPNTEYQHGWHVDAMAAHLEAVHRGEITRLLINIPPGTMKSLLCGVFFPMWEWGPKGKPSYRIIGASHSGRVSLRDNLKCRRLLLSRWYQERWPIKLRVDQSAKLIFENTETGFREAMPMSSMTGSRGDRLIIDDPHSVEGAISDAERETTCRVFEETISTRLNSPIKSAIIVVMQRLHERDVSGLILEKEGGYTHLMLPMEFEPKRRCITPYFKDPRTKPDELLFPARFPRKVVDRDKEALGAVGAAGQLQQRPAPREGALIPVDRLVVIDKMPSSKLVHEKVRYWDKAATEGGSGARTAGVRIEMVTGQPYTYVITSVVKGRWGITARDQTIRLTAELDGTEVRQIVEQEPGSGGKESAEASIRLLAGFSVEVDPVKGAKELRAQPLAAQIGIGNVAILKGEWNQEFIDEGRVFPVGRTRDQWDAAAGAFNKLTHSAQIAEDDFLFVPGDAYAAFNGEERVAPWEL